jgi:hypothetical protein
MRKSALKTLLLFAAAGMTGIAYMLFEAQWLRLRHLTVTLPGLPASLDGLRLLHLSDLHAGAPGPGARAMAKLVDASRRADPDIVVFTGDMVDKKKDLQPHIGLLRKIEARHGKFAVLGNHDHGLRKTVLQDLIGRFTGLKGGRGRAEVLYEDFEQTVNINRRLLAQAGIRLLENECRLVDGDSWKIQVCGIDDFQYGHADLESTTAQIDYDAPLRILLSHSPNAAGCVTNGDFQLLLAGHTHGGQICIPKPGGKIMLSTSGAQYADGLYTLPYMTMHVSRGVGTTLLPFRLFSRPEATLIELRADPDFSTETSP